MRKKEKEAVRRTKKGRNEQESGRRKGRKEGRGDMVKQAQARQRKG